MAHASKDDTPSEALAKLVENAHSLDADHIRDILFGFNHKGPPTGMPLSPNTSYFPLYSFQIPWNDDTGTRLQEIIDHPDTAQPIRHECAWLLKAWLSWQGVPD